MTTFVLIPGAGGQAWYWSRLVPELAARGHTAIAVDLPAADESAGLVEYADAVVAAIGDRSGDPDIVVVAQSMAGFTGPLVCERVPVRQLVLLNAMSPKPGESPDEWWTVTGQGQAQREMALRNGRDPDAPFDPFVDFFHDVPLDVVAEAKAGPPPLQASAPFEKPWPLAAWPDVPTRFLAGSDDRFFPLEFQRRVVADRLRIDVEEIPGGQLLALSQPVALAERLIAMTDELSTR